MRTLYRNGVVVTMDADGLRTDAILVDGGRIAALGAEAIARARGAEEVDLEGRTVVPGLIDAHTHVETAALARQRWVDLREVSHETALERLADRVGRAAPGEWVIGQATFGQRLPSRSELDAIAPRNPVVIRRSMHALTANTPALERAGVLERRYSPVGAIVRRHPGGEPTGEMLEAFHLFPIDLPADDDLATILEAELRERFNRFGVTAIYEVPLSRGGMRAFQRLERDGRLTARVSLNPAVRPGLQPLVDDIEGWASMGLRTGFGNDMLWLGAAKYFMDGDEEASFDVARDPAHPSRWGAPTHHVAEVVRALVIGYESGIQLWIHALGEDAQHLALDAIAEAQRIHGGDGGLRTRVEHIANQRISPDLLRRMRAANVTPVPTAAFINFDTGTGVFAYRTLIENGFMPPGNSDNAGTQPFATNPWFGIGKMRTRRNKHGEEIHPAERVSVLDGLRSYTEFGAAAGLRSGSIGVLRAGGLADFAVLTADPFSTPDDELEGIESMLTVVDGKPVWEASGR